MIVVSLGDRLRQLRIEKKLRQEQVAYLIGLNKKQISAYENDSRRPSLEILCDLASLYRVTTDYLLGCNTRKVLDVTDLSPAEIKIISELVEEMSKKNRKLKNIEENWR